MSAESCLNRRIGILLTGRQAFHPLATHLSNYTSRVNQRHQERLLIKFLDHFDIQTVARLIGNDIADKQRMEGDLKFPEPAARILQYYWELQRFRWIEHTRSQRELISSDSSLMEQMSSNVLL